jgi:hypothetical protein
MQNKSHHFKHQSDSESTSSYRPCCLNCYISSIHSLALIDIIHLKRNPYSFKSELTIIIISIASICRILEYDIPAYYIQHNQHFQPLITHETYYHNLEQFNCVLKRIENSRSIKKLMFLMCRSYVKSFCMAFGL